MPGPEPLITYFISKIGEQPNYSSVGKQIIARKEKPLVRMNKSSEIKLIVDSFLKKQLSRTFCIFHLSPEIIGQIDSILYIIEKHKECLRYNKELETYDKFATLEQKLKDAGYILHLDTAPNSTLRCATDPIRRKRTLSSASLRSISEASSNKERGLHKSATFNNLHHSSFSQRSIPRSNTSTSSLYNDDEDLISGDSELNLNKIHHLERELVEANDARIAAGQEIEKLKEQLQVAQAKAQTTNTAKDAAVQAQQEAEEKLKQANSDKDTAEKTSRDLQKQLEQKQATIDTKQRELNDANTTKIDLEAQLQTAIRDKITAEQEILVLKGQFQATINAKEDATVQAQKTAEKEIAAIQRALDQKTTDNKELWNRFKKSDEEKEKIEQENEELKHQLEEIREKSAQEIEYLKQEVIKAQALHKAKTIITTDVSSRLQKSKEDFCRLENEKADVVRQTDELNAEKEQLLRENKEKVENLEEQIKATNEAKDAAVQTQQTAEQTISTLQEMNRELQAKLEEAKQETERANKVNEKLQRKLDDVEGQAQKDKKDQATQAEIQKPQQNNQDLQLFLQLLRKKLDQHKNLLMQKNSVLALQKADMISTLSELLASFVMNNSNREESLGKLKQQINNSEKTLARHRNIISSLFGYKTTSAQLLSNIKETINPFDTHQSPVEPPNATKTMRPNNNGTTTWVTNETLSHRHR